MNFELATKIKQWGTQLGFAQIGIAPPLLSSAEKHFQTWLSQGYGGEMNYLWKHGAKRTQPRKLMPEVKSIISCALSYHQLVKLNGFPQKTSQPVKIASYALGKDYHIIMRDLLNNLATKISEQIGNFSYRCFVDSGPVLEKPIAVEAGIGWQGKNSLIINPRHGSWLLLGEIFTDLPLPFDKPMKSHCDNCRACIDHCPTKAIVAPYVIDARRCLAYLTIESNSSLREDKMSPKQSTQFDSISTSCFSRTRNDVNKFATEPILKKPGVYTQSISSCDEAQTKSSSGVYKLVNEQRDEFATKSQLERRRVYVYGCDICQSICPWNQSIDNDFDQIDFNPNPNLIGKNLTDLMNWSEEDFIKHTKDSALRRLGFERWRRNLKMIKGEY